MRAQLTRISVSLGSVILVFVFAVDGAKVAQAKQIFQKYKFVIGDNHTNNFITIDGISDEEVRKKVLITSYSFQLAS